MTNGFVPVLGQSWLLFQFLVRPSPTPARPVIFARVYETAPNLEGLMKQPPVRHDKFHSVSNFIYPRRETSDRSRIFERAFTRLVNRHRPRSCRLCVVLAQLPPVSLSLSLACLSLHLLTRTRHSAKEPLYRVSPLLIKSHAIASANGNRGK